MPIGLPVLAARIGGLLFGVPCVDSIVVFRRSKMADDGWMNGEAGRVTSFLRGGSLLERTEATTATRELVEEPVEWVFYVQNILGALFCVAFVALIAGLFLGLLTLDILDLQIIQRAAVNEEERTYATALLPIVKDRHRLLVTLLLLNAFAYECLPIFLDRLVPSWVAVLLSVTIIMVVGEILPSGIFIGPHQIYLGYKMVPLTRFLLWIMYPLATPMTLLLDYLVKGGVGEENAESQSYNRGELAALVRIQYEERINKRVSRVVEWDRTKQANTSTSKWATLKADILEAVNERDDAPTAPREEQLRPPLHAVEVSLVEGSLQLKTRLAMDVYTPLSHVYALRSDLVLNKATISQIYGLAYSRVPVYQYNPVDPSDVTAMVGVLMTRQLMLIDWEDCREVSSLPLQQPECVSPRINLVDLLRILRSKGFLMAFVCARPDLANKALRAGRPLPPEAGFMGIVALEDIMESILGNRIYDEGDIRDRNRAVQTLTRWAATTLQAAFRKKQAAKKRKNENARQTIQQKPGLLVSNGHGIAARKREDERTPLLQDDLHSPGSYS